MSFSRLFVLVFAAVFINSIIHKDYEYEKMILANYRFQFKIHLENFKNSIKVSDLIKKLVYQNNTFDEYILFVENKFIGNIRKDDFPTIVNEDKTEYIYHSYLNESYNVEYYNDLFIIIKYNVYFLYSGMAHGNYLTKYFILDLIDERILDINDLIFQMPDEIIKDIIQENYKIDYYLRENIWPPDTISFQNDNIILMWNTYSITPYVYGLIEIKINDKIIESYYTEKLVKLKKSMSKDN